MGILNIIWLASISTFGLLVDIPIGNANSAVASETCAITAERY